MLSSSLSLWLGAIFVLTGAINVWAILQSTIRMRSARAGARLVAIHRIGGYLFIALFCVMGYFMVQRLGDVAGGASSTTLIHLTLAMVLGPLLFVKVLIARYYKTYYSILMPIGLIIFVLSFVLIGITAGPTLAHRGTVQTVSLPALDLPPAPLDLTMAASTMEKRCSKCHTLDRVAGARKDARGWLATVNRMKALPDSGIPDEDARTIVSYLASQMAPKDGGAAANREVARALVDQRCGKCHSLDRVYKTAESPGDWRSTVDRMAGYAEGSANALPPREVDQIVAYLSATQTPEALSERKAQAAAASATGQPLGKPEQPAPPVPTAQANRYDLKMIGFISFVFLSALALVSRRPRSTPLLPKSEARKDRIQAALPAAPAAAMPAASALVLRLASITQQTSDSKTLRFIIADGRKLDARPGQFLTFSFLFDGKKVTRSYSICSSPVRTGYVEITPKRVSQGCVSVFLNDRATVGLTVEAKGAFGQFYFDETRHRNIVMLAAGSGITPMISMLRYIDDLCLDTTATLLYSVRTASDIIFERELEQLKSRLNSFQYHILLSKPDAAWTGPRGRMSREFIEEAVTDFSAPDFFLCGPPAFMETCRSILQELTVKPERIKQESFGSPGPKQAPDTAPAAASTATVEFARSGKTCALLEGQTVLEAAEEHGVTIPFSCRQGQCGTCKTKLLEGTIQMDAEEGLDPDSRAQGLVLLCVGRAQGKVRLDA